MFKNQEEHLEAVDTIIGPSVSVEGEFKGEGNIIVEGEVKGGVKTKGFLKATETSIIHANINAGDAEISGQVLGNIRVKGNLEIKETAIIEGDIAANTLSVSLGAVINGNIKMKNGKAGDESGETKENNEEEIKK